MAKANPDLVARDEEGEPYIVRYEAVNAMLLNELLKEHRKVGEQEATISHLKTSDAKHATTIAQQQKAIEALTATLKAQAAQTQKVSDQIKAQAPAPRVAADN